MSHLGCPFPTGWPGVGEEAWGLVFTFRSFYDRNIFSCLLLSRLSLTYRKETRDLFITTSSTNATETLQKTTLMRASIVSLQQTCRTAGVKKLIYSLHGQSEERYNLVPRFSLLSLSLAAGNGKKRDTGNDIGRSGLLFLSVTMEFTLVLYKVVLTLSPLMKS